MPATDRTLTERLTPQQMNILGVVKECGPVTASKVGGHLRISYSSAHSGLQALERKGLVGAVYTGQRMRGRAYEASRRGRTVASDAFED
jgi:predicted ArsR family transcriptional regulator